MKSVSLSQSGSGEIVYDNLLMSETLVKVVGNPAVYMIGSDGKRYLFSNSDTFWSHYNGSWSNLKYNGQGPLI